MLRSIAPRRFRSQQRGLDNMATRLRRNQSIYVAGHQGMVGSACLRLLSLEGFTNVITAGRSDLDLRDADSVRAFFKRSCPDVVIMAAARVGGIQSNRTFPADFLYDNLMIQSNMIDQARRANVSKLVFLGSSCIYPKECPQPMKESYLLTGPLEPTNEAYALAKIAGLRMAQYYHTQYGLNCLCPMPCNLYGPNDSFDLKHSHVLSALVKRFVDAADDGIAEITLWGTGAARREFMHVDDLARAILFLLEAYDSPEIINIGTGNDHTIRELAELIAAKAGFTGCLRWDTSMPDGMLRKCMDVSKMRELGFTPLIDLSTGVDDVISEYRSKKTALGAS